MKARLDAEALNQRVQAAIVRADFLNAQTEREMNEGLSKEAWSTDSKNGKAVMDLLRELHRGGATICIAR